MDNNLKKMTDTMFGKESDLFKALPNDVKHNIQNMTDKEWSEYMKRYLIEEHINNESKHKNNGKEY